MKIIDKVLGRFEDFEVDQLHIDRVILSHGDLAKPHQLLKTQEGMELGLSLPHGEQLFYGAVLLAEESKLIVVDLTEEDVLEMYPRGNVEWARTAFNIGNMHHPAYLHEDCILVPYDSVIERMIKKLGVSYKRSQRKLSGLRANVTVHGEHHHG